MPVLPTYQHNASMIMARWGNNDGVLPSKIRTAVGKSLTLLAALRAAVMTDGEGTRS